MSRKLVTISGLAAALINDLPDPKHVGASEYSVLHEHLVNVRDSMENQDDPKECEILLTTCDELSKWAKTCHRKLRRNLAAKVRATRRAE